MATVSKSATQPNVTSAETKKQGTDTVERRRRDAGNAPALYLPAAAVQHSPQFLREVDNPKTSGQRALLRVDNL
ncbi:MAG TPA: hypothetical protein VGP76_29945 [Planctomycetaceae bacterium]|jgi:hypothetical protein|nr:hypothetical protein [Planctomycetaceae bacterium]